MMQEFVQQVDNLAQGALNGIHTAVPGRILSYDAAMATATILPEARMNAPDGRTFPYPSICGVPVVFPQGGGQRAAIAFPVKPGDTCLLIVCENDLQGWIKEGKDCGNGMKFDLTNSICIPGMFRSGSMAAVKADNENALVLMNGDKGIIIRESGIEINGNVLVHGKVTEG